MNDELVESMTEHGGIESMVLNEKTEEVTKHEML